MGFKELGEFIFAGATVVSAIYIIYKRVRNSNNHCNSCGSCSKMCPRYNQEKGENTKK